jgi:hypothetical protein
MYSCQAWYEGFLLWDRGLRPNTEIPYSAGRGSELYKADDPPTG